MEAILSTNTALPSYGITSEDILSLLTVSKSFVDDLPYHIFLKQTGVSAQALTANPSDILLLRMFKPCSLTMASDHELFSALLPNLCLNQRAIRTETLRVLSMFDTLKYEESREKESGEQETDTFKDKDCEVI